MPENANANVNNKTNAKRNTSGLEKFGRARDIVLAKHGFDTYADFTEAVRNVYKNKQLSGFDGWRVARDDVLKANNLKNGYASLMDESKKQFRQMP